MSKLLDYSKTLSLIVSHLSPKSCDTDVSESHRVTSINIQLVLKKYGHDVSLSQAEELWGNYSYNSFASWLGDAETVEEAESAIVSFCHDIEHGENHIGY